MKRIHNGTVFDVIPEENGIVYAFRIPEVKNAPLKQGEIPLDYKYYNYVTRTTERVDRDIYQLAKYGANYVKITNACKNYVLARALLLPEGKVFLVEDDGSAMLFDGSGEMVWNGSMKYKNKIPSAIALAKDGLWATFTDFDAVVRFNATTMKSEIRLGKKGDVFDNPIGLYSSGDKLYVCSSGSRKVIEVDIATFKTTDIYGFTEPIIAYKKVKHGEAVILKSGLYLIE